MAVQTEASVFKSGFASKKPTGRSGFGQQASSRKTTAPIFSIGHSTRTGSTKVFLSSAHEAAEKRGTFGPGPVYEHPSSLDKQTDAQKETAPQYSFSKSERMKSAGSWVPGPGRYTSQGALGPQADSNKMTNPQYRFGTTTRNHEGRRFISSAHEQRMKGTAGAPPGAYESMEALGSQHSSLRLSSPAFSMPRTERLKDRNEKLSQSMPSVGCYEARVSLGKQALSQTVTVPSYGFGSSSRDKESSRFMSANHTAKTHMGLYSPSHFKNQTDGNTTSIGRQNLSQRCTSPMTKFGTARRLVTKENDTPGPGAYD